jgi:hypothetical protein
VGATNRLTELDLAGGRMSIEAAKELKRASLYAGLLRSEEGSKLRMSRFLRATSSQILCCENCLFARDFVQLKSNNTKKGLEP